VGTEHQRGTFRNFIDVIDKDDALGPKLCNNVLVVNYLVITVNRRIEDSDHPRQGFDRFFHSRTETSWGGEKDLIDSHGYQGTP
jgi:hypothetical protein